MILAIDATVVNMENAAPEMQPWMVRKSPVREIGPLMRILNGLGGYAPSGVLGDPTPAAQEKRRSDPDRDGSGSGRILLHLARFSHVGTFHRARAFHR